MEGPCVYCVVPLLLAPLPSRYPHARWVQSELRQLSDSETPEATDLLRRATHCLRARPVLFRYCAEEVCSLSTVLHFGRKRRGGGMSTNPGFNVRCWSALSCFRTNPVVCVSAFIWCCLSSTHHPTRSSSLAPSLADRRHAAQCALPSLYRRSDAWRSRWHAPTNRSARP